MPEETEDLVSHLTALITPGARARLVSRGLARGMIWREGLLPEQAPEFSRTLTVDLLDHGFQILGVSLRLHESKEHENLAIEGFRVAAESIEAAARRGNQADSERGFHLVVSAAAFHLARLAARSYCIVNKDLGNTSLSTIERALVLLMRRNLRGLRDLCFTWLSSQQNSDEFVAVRLAEDPDFFVDDLLTLAATRNYLRALSLFLSALETGELQAVQGALDLLSIGERATGEANIVPMWWMSALSKRIADDLWSTSLHQALPRNIQSPDEELWSALREDFITLLTSRDIAEIDLWPSQLEAATRAIDPLDDLVEPIS